MGKTAHRTGKEQLTVSVEFVHPAGAAWLFLGNLGRNNQKPVRWGINYGLRGLVQFTASSTTHNTWQTFCFSHFVNTIRRKFFYLVPSRVLS